MPEDQIMSTRRGRKMGVFHVYKENSRLPIADVEYRFDDKRGVFFADYSDASFENSSRDQLRATVEAFVRERMQVEFEPMIRVEMPAVYERSWSHYRQPKHEISLTVHLLLVSRERFKHESGHDRKYRLTREGYLDEATGQMKATSTSATDGHRWDSDDHPWDVLLPYTSERLKALRAIQDAIATTRGRLLELIGDVRMVDQVAINGEARIGLIGVAAKEP